MRKAFSLALAMTAAATAGTALAQTRSQVWGRPLEQQAQTVYARADAGMTTYESEAAGSKETAETTAFHVGGWAGEYREVGAQVSSSETAVPFALNGAESRLAFRDVRLMARFGWVIPSIGASLTEMDVKENGGKTVGVLGTGPNAGLAVWIPMTHAIVVGFDAMHAPTTKSLDKLKGDAKLGARSEGDVSASVDVTDRAIDLLVGYKVRRYSLEDARGEFDEQSQGAYAGLRLGLYF